VNGLRSATSAASSGRSACGCGLCQGRTRRNKGPARCRMKRPLLAPPYEGGEPSRRKARTAGGKHPSRVLLFQSCRTVPALALAGASCLPSCWPTWGAANEAELRRAAFPSGAAFPGRAWERGVCRTAGQANRDEQFFARDEHLWQNHGKQQGATGGFIRQCELRSTARSSRSECPAATRTGSKLPVAPGSWSCPLCYPTERISGGSP